MDIKIVRDNVNYEGMDCVAMLNIDSEEFSITFQKKEDVENIKYQNNGPIYMPQLILGYKEIICDFEDNCNIFYNDVINTETLLTGFFINEILNNHHVDFYETIKYEELKDILDKLNLENMIQDMFVEDEDFSDNEVEVYSILVDEFDELYDNRM